MQWREVFSGVVPNIDELSAVFVLFLPRALGALLVLLLGWVLAIVVRAALRRLSARVARSLPAGRTRATLGDAVETEAGQALSIGGYWLVLFTAFLVAAETLGLPALSAWIAGFGRYVPQVIIAVIIVFAGVVVGRIAGAALARVAGSVVGENAGKLGRGLHILIVAVGFLVAANQVDIDVSLITTVAVVVFGAALFGASLAFALGARGVVSNILAMHYFAKRHAPGDIVELDAFTGRVVEITPTSVILDAEQGQVEIPGDHFTRAACVRRPPGSRDA